MNRYKDEWFSDYNQFLYHVREQMKRDAYDHIYSSSTTYEDNIQYAEQIIKSHFMRSVQAFLISYGRKRTHPNFEEYAAMMLNQDNYLHLVPENVRHALVCKYGKMKGISSGTIYRPAAK